MDDEQLISLGDEDLEIVELDAEAEAPGEAILRSLAARLGELRSGSDPSVASAAASLKELDSSQLHARMLTALREMAEEARAADGQVEPTGSRAKNRGRRGRKKTEIAMSRVTYEIASAYQVLAREARLEGELEVRDAELLLVGRCPTIRMHRRDELLSKTFTNWFRNRQSEFHRRLLSKITRQEFQEEASEEPSRLPLFGFLFSPAAAKAGATATAGVLVGVAFAHPQLLDSGRALFGSPPPRPSVASSEPQMSGGDGARQQSADSVVAAPQERDVEEWPLEHEVVGDFPSVGLDVPTGVGAELGSQPTPNEDRPSGTIVAPSCNQSYALKPLSHNNAPPAGLVKSVRRAAERCAAERVKLELAWCPDPSQASIGKIESLSGGAICNLPNGTQVRRARLPVRAESKLRRCVEDEAQTDWSWTSPKNLRKRWSEDDSCYTAALNMSNRTPMPQRLPDVEAAP